MSGGLGLGRNPALHKPQEGKEDVTDIHRLRGEGASRTRT